MDPLLKSHEVMPRFFNLGGRIDPVSIRDQMVRAQSIVERAAATGLIDREHPLLVVGAGAAGATAAIRAAQLNIKTVLIDRWSAPFLLQRQCRTRWVDPVQYDWWAPHWNVGRYPHRNRTISGNPAPLPWSEERSHRIAAKLETLLNGYARGMPNLLSIMYSSTAAVVHSANARGWDLTVNGQYLQASAVIWTIGLGAERHVVKPPPNASRQTTDYAGYSFWETDAYEQIFPNRRRARIVISGSGDGGMQDFIRLTTKIGNRSAKEIYDHFGFTNSFYNILRDKLGVAQDEVLRGFHWTDRGRYEHDVVRPFHFACQSLVDEIFAGNYHPAIDNVTVMRAIDGALRDDFESVKLIYSCDHFTNSYPLNRFLVLLIATFLERETNRKVLVASRNIHEIVGIGHTCLSAATCFATSHKIQLANAPLCYEKARPIDDWLEADIIVIRHGIQGHPTPAIADIDFPRQILPLLP
jgi:hypothetical protein